MQHPWNKGLALIGLALIGVTAITASAQPINNAWTNTTSGSWEDHFWSLGALPGTNQSILLTNAGWKAVAIGPGTAQIAPQTMSVDSITLGGPPGTLNVLLLNYAGYQNPVTAKVMTVNTNSAVTVLASILELTNSAGASNRLEIGGAVNQGEGSVVNPGTMSLGNIGPGIYNLTNGSLTVVTAYVGGTFTGEINQYGGTNEISDLLFLWGDIERHYASGGRYFLSNGLLSSAGTVVGPNSLFHQIGGSFINHGNLRFTSVNDYSPYTYARGYGILDGGQVQTDSMDLYGTYFTQSGGTNEINGPLTIQGYAYGGSSEFDLSGGLLTARNLVVVGDGASARLAQSGGSVAAPNLRLDLRGASFGYNEIYDLSGGTLVVSNLAISGKASFLHRGGAFTHQGLLTLAGGRWNEQTTGQQFGSVQLSYNENTNSVLAFPTNTCVMQFADSSTIPWSNGVSLIVMNWAGSAEGGGRHRIIFGTNNLSLTPQQLSAIFFADVPGLPSGLCPARLLPTGELVPAMPTPVLVRGASKLPDGAFSLTLNGVAGDVYRIAVSTDLVHWSWWTDATNQNGTVVIEDSAAAVFPKRFYRAFVQP